MCAYVVFFAGGFFALADADGAFVAFVFACAFLAIGFGFWAFSFRSLAQRAFAAALIFALPAAESPRLFRGAAAFIAGTVDCPPIIADSCARFSCKSAISISRPMRASCSNSATSSLLVLGIDQSSDHLLVMAPGITPPQMAIDGGIVGESMMRPKA